MKAKGIEPGKVLVNILDEPHKKEHFETFRLWAKSIKKHSNYLRVWTDANHLGRGDNLKYAQEMFRYVDVICPEMSQYLEYDDKVTETLRGQQKNGKILWLYMCQGPTREFDPSYYRLQPWKAYAIGATGSCFWGFCDAGKCRSSWNDYMAKGVESYTPVYLSPDDITTAKQMEAIREGLEDYRYLVLLEGKIGSEFARRLADRIFNLAIDSGGKKFWEKWSDDNYAALGDTGRLEIMKILER